MRARVDSEAATRRGAADAGTSAAGGSSGNRVGAWSGKEGSASAGGVRGGDAARRRQGLARPAGVRVIGLVLGVGRGKRIWRKARDFGVFASRGGEVLDRFLLEVGRQGVNLNT